MELSEFEDRGELVQQVFRSQRHAGALPRRTLEGSISID